MQGKKKQQGFTLIELIIVIVILGILAVTAAPKFIDISGDATASTLQGVKAAVQGGSQLVFAKSAIAGEQNNENGAAGLATGADDVVINGVTVDTEYGYPDADNTTATSLRAWVDLNLTAVTGDWALTGDSPAAGSFRITPLGGAVAEAPTGTADDTRCQVTYTNAASEGASPTIVAEIEGC